MAENVLKGFVAFGLGLVLVFAASRVDVDVDPIIQPVQATWTALSQ